MKLSVIIVNYNVKYFLEQCLHSVQNAILPTLKGLVDIFVVDNASVDGSSTMVREQFPNVKLIANQKNVGFSCANNQAIRLSESQYVLLLNPDTLVQEDTFEKIIQFMDKTPNAGGLGVKMINGKGVFLPESKRALPTPEVAFYKIFGLSRLFPKSRIFGKYHLGFLDKNQTHEVEVLSGAFMLLRKEAIGKSGIFDEAYFMYGEDIDLSYRIIQAGYKNYYFPETTIIHYKGESTKKGSINYVMVFYNAMLIFAKKHFTGKKATMFAMILQFAIYFRASLAISKRLVNSLAIPLFEALIVYLCFVVFCPIWAKVIFEDGGTYPPIFLNTIVPIYILNWLFFMYFFGAYDKPYDWHQVIKGILYGSIVLILVYSLLPQHLRFSRFMLLFGAAATFITAISLRVIFHYLKIADNRMNIKRNRRVLVVGGKGEFQRIGSILDKCEDQVDMVGFICDKSLNGSNFYLGAPNQICETVRINKISEVIFSAKDILAQDIISYLLLLSSKDLDFKIASAGSLSIIGTHSINTLDEIFEIHLNSISTKMNIRMKRFFDVILAILFFASFFISFFWVKKKGGFLNNIFSVLLNNKSWVGYISNTKSRSFKLPKIKRGVLSPIYLQTNPELNQENIDKINLLYAKNYSILNDLLIIVKGFRNLGENEK